MLNEKEIKVLNLIIQDISLENYFFKKVKNLKWFFPLKENGYFSPEEAPKPQPAEKEGYFKIPQWNVLPYLEKVSQQVTQPENEKYIDELLSIINDVTKYHIEHNKCLDNYHTWWYFVKILCNLPTNKITDEMLDFIPYWLDSKFDNTLPAEEILERLLPKFLDSNEQENFKKAEKIVDIVTQITWQPIYTEQQKKEIKEKYKHIFDKPEEERTDEEKLEIVFFRLDEEEPKTIVDKHLLIESFINNKIASEIGEKCSENIIFNLANKLKSIFEKEQQSGKADLSYIWFPSLFDALQIYNTEQVITLILRDILTAKSKNDKDITLKIIEKFQSEYLYPLFLRLSLFIIGTHWNNYKEIFWNLLDKDDITGRIFNDPHYEAEAYTILQRYGNQFLVEEKEKIKNIIETKVPNKPHTEEKYREYYSAYMKQKWYSALKYDDYFKTIYEKYKSITKEEEHLTFNKQNVKVGPGSSPITKEDILRESNKELAEYLKKFKPDNSWDGPTIEGLLDVFKNVVQEKPEKFIDDLNPFLKTGYIYVHDILWGIREAWEKKKIINWEKVFNFIQEYIKPENFWNDEYIIKNDYWKANHLWVVGIIGELIKQGSIDDSWAFPEEHFQIAQEILFLIIDKMLSEKDKILSEKPITGDFLVYALNSSFGKIIEALFTLALIIKRIEKETQKTHTVSWEINIKNKYDLLLSSEIVESYVWLGRYLPNFYYIDKKWTESKIKTLTNKDELWKAFMDGYLSSGRVYDELYILMNPHYEKAINYQFKEKYFPDRLIQHICIGYLRGIDSIDDGSSLFRKLLDKWDTSQIKEMIGFFWMQRRDYERKPDKSVVLDKDGKPKVIKHKQEQEQLIEDEERTKIKEKIINFWKWVYENKYKGKQGNELDNKDKEILSKLSNLTVFLSEIDSENVEWLKISAWCVGLNFHSSLFFIEYLDELKDKGKSVDFVGEVYIEILKNATPVFRKENIMSIVEFLYQKGKKEEADTICNIYGSRGYEFLRQLYEKYATRKTN